MSVITGHKTFDRYANYIGSGNVTSNVQFSSYIRPESHMLRPDGVRVPPGSLRDFDLRPFRKAGLPAFVERAVLNATKHEPAILYRFSHPQQNPRRSVVDGYVLTRDDHDLHALIEFWVTGPTHASARIIETTAKMVANPSNSLEIYVRDVVPVVTNAWHSMLQTMTGEIREQMDTVLAFLDRMRADAHCNGRMLSRAFRQMAAPIDLGFSAMPEHLRGQACQVRESIGDECRSFMRRMADEETKVAEMAGLRDVRRLDEPLMGLMEIAYDHTIDEAADDGPSMDL